MDEEKPVKAKHARWLLAELPAWEAEGLLSPGQAEALRLRYVPAAGGRNWATTLFFIAGLLVAGLGIVLILAHNWEELSRPLRAALALAPFLPALGLGYFALWKRPESPLFREGAGALLATAVAASIALVGQTYQFPGDEWSYLRTCLILIIPSAYVLRSAAAAVAAFLCLIAMTSTLSPGQGHHLQFYLLLAATLGYLFLVSRTNRHGAQAAVLSWAAALCLAFTLNAVVGPYRARLTSTFLFAAMVCLGRTRFSGAPDFWRRGFEIVGGCGIVLGMLIFDSIGGKPLDWSTVLRLSPADMWSVGTAGALLALAVLLWLDGLRAHDAVAGLFGAAWLAEIAAQTIWSSSGDQDWVIVIHSIYHLVLGAGLVWTGTRAHSLGRVNVGSLILIILVLFRFFDQDFSFVARGVAFLAAGAGFILLHLWARRRLGDAS